MAEGETRTEYRVVATGSHLASDHTSQVLTREEVGYVAAEECRHFRDVRIQKRTVTETPWEDVTDA